MSQGGPKFPQQLICCDLRNLICPLLIYVESFSVIYLWNESGKTEITNVDADLTGDRDQGQEVRTDLRLSWLPPLAIFHCQPHWVMELAQDQPWADVYSLCASPELWGECLPIDWSLKCGTWRVKVKSLKRVMWLHRHNGPLRAQFLRQFSALGMRGKASWVSMADRSLFVQRKENRKADFTQIDPGCSWWGGIVYGGRKWTPCLPQPLSAQVVMRRKEGKPDISDLLWNGGLAWRGTQPEPEQHYKMGKMFLKLPKSSQRPERTPDSCNQREVPSLSREAWCAILFS